MRYAVLNAKKKMEVTCIFVYCSKPKGSSKLEPDSDENVSSAVA